MSELAIKSDVPALRIDVLNRKAINEGGRFVLYWMIAARRSHSNFGLERAVDWARHLNKPLVVLEALRCDYPWASDRLHTFVVEGMAENARRFEKKPVTYFPFLETKRGEGRGLLEALAAEACVIVADEYPCFFLPRMVKAAAGKVAVKMEAVDSNGLLPMRATERVFSRAVDFRRFLQKELLPHLAEMPKSDPLARVRLPRQSRLPKAISERWPAADVAALAKNSTWLAKLPIDHAVGRSPIKGGAAEAAKRLKAFIKRQLTGYDEFRDHPDANATSGLSPYLHFGHISAHEIFEAVVEHEGWNPTKVAKKATGKNSGWWGMSPAAEAFVDQIATWREIGFNMCHLRADYDQYESLPNWAQKTLAEHAKDKRKVVYSVDQLATAATYDEVWNAAQRQLNREGEIHNYLRMVWGKKILQWTKSPRQALDVMLELNNRYALDGRDPNSYSGIFWVLGRYDRAWGPERPIFGKIRYMSSRNTLRKLHMKEYLEQYSK